MRKRSEVGVPGGSVDGATVERFEAEMKPAPELLDRGPGTRVPPRDDGDPAVAGTTVAVTWAEEQYQPVQFNTFRVGPFSATAVVRPGESVAQATCRLHAELDVAAGQIRDQKVADYLAALRKMCGR